MFCENSATSVAVNAFLTTFLGCRRVPLSVAPMQQMAQLTGALVTGFAAFGADRDLLSALPLGLFAGVLALLLVRIADAARTIRVRAR